MPISPAKKALYPKDWPAISRRIRERAGDKCEWCGLANGAIGYRSKDGTWQELADCIENAGMEVEVAALDGFKVVRIVLTVAHLGTAHDDGTPGDKHDKMDVRDCNLAALCQKCHLNYDRDEHTANRRKTLMSRKAAGCLPGMEAV